LTVLPAAGLCQPTLLLLGFSPDQSPTSLPSLSLRYDVTSASATPCTVRFQRDDGTLTTVTGVVPGSGPFAATVPLPTGVDGRTVTYAGFVQQPPGGLTAGDRMLTIVADDVGPAAVVVTAPAFPATTFSTVLTATGQVRKADGTPDPGGRVDVTRRDGAAAGTVIGGGVVDGTGRFTAALSLAGLPTGTAVPLRFQAYDAAGNGGATFDTTVTYQAGGGTVSVTGLQMTPPAGTVTNNPGIMLRGTVTGTGGPFLVTFLVDGFVESTLTGLASGTSFGHTLTLAGDGAHTVQVRAGSAAGAVFGPQPLGTVTLDRTPPGPPIITSPSPTAPFHTSADTFVIAGVAPETPSGGASPGKIFMRSSAAVRFSPVQPQTVTGTGSFTTTVDISALPDGLYVIDVFYSGGAGNYSSPAARFQVAGRGGAPSAPRSPLLESAHRLDDVAADTADDDERERLRRAADDFRRQGRRDAFLRLHGGAER